MNGRGVRNMDEENFVIKDGDYEIRIPEYERVPYQQIFYNPNGVPRWAFAESFYTVARNTVERIIADSMREDVEGKYG
jgi:hypothetical protein